MFDIINLTLRGVWFDLVTLSFFLIPLSLFQTALIEKFQGTKFDRYSDNFLRFLFSFILFFTLVAEHLFWLEFHSRFNFIAVDYLVYTNEVIGNIAESYPLWIIFPAIGFAAFVMTYISKRIFPLKTQGQKTGFKNRLGFSIANILVALILYSLSSTDQTKFGDNAEARELAGNGVYNLFYSFFNNEINYNKFYLREKIITAEEETRALLTEEDSVFKNDTGKDFTKIITVDRPEIHKNVILVVMESMSADYMGTFGNQDKLTPNLDKFAKEGILFRDTYATGTRTVRGLEAVALSIPPTPGQSIVRRKGNKDLFSIGFVLKDRGYDTKFIYGGYGYFDNMNEFFGNNGFQVVDRTDINEKDIEFANVWGICDEDLFKQVIKEADESFSKGKKFASLVMTTSNHRPYTYPDGRIDIPSKEGRLGGVKYADYSVGKLIEGAKDKQWFKDTIFVFVADHTAGAAGKVELDPAKYHIPMIFYSPGFIEPQVYDKVASQIDTAPILLGLMNFSYNSKFYGEDLLNDKDEIPHAYISNYQKIALIKNDVMTVLEPKKMVEQFSWPDIKIINEKDQEAIDQAVAYYQSASWWKNNYKRVNSVVQ